MVRNIEISGIDDILEDGDTALFTLNRRSFFGGVSALLAVSVVLPSSANAIQLVAGLKDINGQDATPSLFVNIEKDNKVRIICHRSEMGQQIWTSMGQIVADELDADWDDVEIVQATGHPRYGDQNTDGSKSVRLNLTRLRYVGAGMRHMLVAAAATKWGVSASDCTAKLGAVLHSTSGRQLTYGEVASDAAELPVPRQSDVMLKDRKDWRYIGKAVASLTVPKVLAGTAIYGIDVRLDNMVHAVIARPPQLFGGIESVDDQAALAVPGVIRTVQLEPVSPPAGFKALGGVAVIAKNTWAAIKGREVLKIAWSDGPNADYDSAKFEVELLKTARAPGKVRANRGEVAPALESAKKRISADYYVPHLIHAPIEPPAATAIWKNGQIECWACVQNPQAARTEIANALTIEEDQVTVNVTMLGGAFGRKSKPDFAVEAALLAREIGRPVKVTWTREDELAHGYYHSVSAQHLEGGLDGKGKCTAWLHRSVFPPIGSTFNASRSTPTGGELSQGVIDNPFQIDNFRIESGDASAKVRIGWLRSVANIYHAFAVQSFAAELAHAAGRDQKDYLLDLIGPDRVVDMKGPGFRGYRNYGAAQDDYPIDTARLRNVIEIAAKKSNWGRKLPKGHGLGIAAHRSFVSYVATVIEVAVNESGELRIPGAWSVIDAGTVVNPGHVEAQLEGGVLFGLSNALYGEISMQSGAVSQHNFPDFRIMRIDEAPRYFEAHVVDSVAPPGGVGEPGTPTAAPALANALFAATGERVRRLPIFGPGGRSSMAHRMGDRRSGS